jgi:hypothetical protein
MKNERDKKRGYRKRRSNKYKIKREVNERMKNDRN